MVIGDVTIDSEEFDTVIKFLEDSYKAGSSYVLKHEHLYMDGKLTMFESPLLHFYRMHIFVEAIDRALDNPDISEEDKKDLKGIKELLKGDDESYQLAQFLLSQNPHTSSNIDDSGYNRGEKDYVRWKMRSDL